MSALDESVAAAVEVLREYRDDLPRVPAIRCLCGNILGPHNHSGCGERTTMWSQDAWQIEYRARDLEAAHQRRQAVTS